MSVTTKIRKVGKEYPEIQQVDVFAFIRFDEYNNDIHESRFGVGLCVRVLDLSLFSSTTKALSSSVVLAQENTRHTRNRCHHGVEYFSDEPTFCREMTLRLSFNL